jgi:hypothetical protein
MLSFTESMMIARNKRNVENADHTTSLLEAEILRLQAVVDSQSATIRTRDALILAGEQQAKADACSIAGYRAYVEYMRGVCDEKVLNAASDAFVAARDANAQSLAVKIKPDEKKKAA